MKKLSIVLFIFTAIAFFACKKTTNNSTSSAKSQWTLFSKTYLADTTYFIYNAIDMQLRGLDSSADEATVLFRYRPVANGNFFIRDAATINDGIDLDSNQCVVVISFADTLFYSSTVNTGTASVTVSAGGKLNVNFSNVKVRNFADTNDSTFTSGSLHEQ
jgi:hypothetical protein